MFKRRVVITGMGCITPLGESVEEFWQGLIQGKSGIDYITQFDTENFPIKIAAEVKNFDPLKFMDPKTVDRTSRFSQFAIASAKMAVEESGLDFSQEDKERIGVTIATTIDIRQITQEFEVLKSKGPKRISPLFITKVGPHVAAVQIGILYGLKGPNSSINTACASGADALATAFDLIQLDYADVMIAGGTDSAITDLNLAAMNLMGALSRNPDPKKACRPFDLNRSGFVYGEGGAALILESLEHAQSRGAKILAELAGVGRSFDAYNETAPNYETEALAMRLALEVAGLKPEEIDYINAHGTSTKLNDLSETKAIKTALGQHAYQIPISSNKSMIGHIITAAGSIEAVATVLTIKNGVIPPTINYETPDPECDLDYVPNVARQAQVKNALSNSFGLGGQNCSLIFSSFEE